MTASTSLRQGTSIADPNNPSNVLVPNAQNAAAIVKSDSTVFSPPTIGVWVGTTGDVAVRMYGSQTNVTFKNVPSGTMLPIQVDQVLSTGTGALDIVRLW